MDHQAIPHYDGPSSNPSLRWTIKQSLTTMDHQAIPHYDGPSSNPSLRWTIKQSLTTMDHQAIPHYDGPSSNPSLRWTIKQSLITTRDHQRLPPRSHANLTMRMSYIPSTTLSEEFTLLNLGCVSSDIGGILWIPHTSRICT